MNYHSVHLTRSLSRSEVVYVALLVIYYDEYILHNIDGNCIQ